MSRSQPSSFPPTVPHDEDEDMGQSVSTTQNEFQMEVNKSILQEFLSKISRCQSLPEVVRTIPAPAQEESRSILEKTYQAFSRKGASDLLLKEWNDALNTSQFDRISALNSLKAPTIQISDLAKEVDGEAIASITFSATLVEAKKAALQKMIELKQQEISNLKQLCDEQMTVGKLRELWLRIQGEDGITPEHLTILQSPPCTTRVVQAVISLGINSLSRIRLAKEKKTEQKKNAGVKMTDVNAGDTKKLNDLIAEALKRRDQSNKDKKLSGKGKRKAGLPSKNNQNNKNGPSKVKKNRKGKNAKRGNSTKQQPKKR